MTFENFAKLTQSTLRNEPYVSSFYDIVFDHTKVKRGDLFISNETETIKKALKRGAYAILSDQQVPMLDEEIAWFRCPDIPHAITAMLRYQLMERELRFFHFDRVTIALAQKIVPKGALLFLEGDIFEDYQKIMHADDTAIVLSHDETFLQKIYPNYSLFVPQHKEKLIPLKSTLFQSTLHYRERHFENLKIAELFLPKLENLLAFLEQCEIPFDLARCDHTPALTPLFVSRDLQIRPFGTTPSAIIVVDPDYADEATREEIVAWFRKRAAWAKICYLSRENDLEVSSVISRNYQKLTEIAKLKEVEFNFAIISAHLPQVEQVLKNIKIKEQPALF